MSTTFMATLMMIMKQLLKFTVDYYYYCQGVGKHWIFFVFYFFFLNDYPYAEALRDGMNSRAVARSAADPFPALRASATSKSWTSTPESWLRSMRT